MTFSIIRRRSLRVLIFGLVSLVAIIISDLLIAKYKKDFVYFAIQDAVMGLPVIVYAVIVVLRRRKG